MRRPIYDTVRINLPYDLVAGAVRQGPGQWLPEAEPMDSGDGRSWCVRMTCPGVLSAAVDTLVEVGALEDTPGLLVVPVAWRAVRAEAAFPLLNAELEFEHVTADVTRATMVGSYKPPLSVVGAAADLVVGHMVAEGVVRSFLEGINLRLRDVTSGSEAPTLHV